MRYRHKKRGTEYVLIGIGKMQAEKWINRSYYGGQGVSFSSVDMHEVAIYRSVDDGSLWVRPREEFEDGRFEAIEPPPKAALPHLSQGAVSVKDALAQLSDAIAREEKEREASDRVFTTLHVNIEKSEPTAEFAEALRDYWLKEGKPALTAALEAKP